MYQYAGPDQAYGFILYLHRCMHVYFEECNVLLCAGSNHVRACPRSHEAVAVIGVLFVIFLTTIDPVNFSWFI